MPCQNEDSKRIVMTCEGFESNAAYAKQRRRQRKLHF